MGIVHQGISSGGSARVKSLFITATGYNPTGSEVLSLGHAYMRTIKAQTAKNEDFQTAHRPYALDVEITHETFMATWAALLNLYKLQTNGFVDAWLTMGDGTGDIYNFINDATPSSPAGSTNLGLAFEYNHTVKKASLKAMLSGQMSINPAGTDEVDWWTGATGSTTGGTGTSTIGLVVGGSGTTRGGGFSLGSDVPPNYRSIQLTNSTGAALVGTNVDFSFDLKSGSVSDKDARNRYIHNHYDWILKFKSMNAKAAEIDAWNNDAQAGVAALVTDSIGRTINLPSVPCDYILTKGDDGNFIEGEIKGRTVINTTGQDAIDIGVGTATELKILNVGNT